MNAGTHLIKYDFVLVSDEESRKLREERSLKALEALGRKVKLINGLPVPDVD